MRGETRSWESPSLPQQTYEDLRRVMLSAAGRMSREQLIELADDLFDQVRERRLPSWRADSNIWRSPTCRSR